MAIASATHRAQIGVTSVTAWLVLLAALLSLITARYPHIPALLLSRLGVLFSYPEAALSGGLSSVSGFSNRYLFLVGLAEETELQKERIARLEEENSKLSELEIEATRLRALLQMRDQSRVSGVAARVVGREATTWDYAFRIDVGTEQGVTTGMPVLSGRGVVGQVVATTPTTSRVLLVNSPMSAVDVVVQSSRARGVVEGARDHLRLNYVGIDEQVAIGDRVIASGLDGIFQKGMLVGVVAEVNTIPSQLFQDIVVTPAVLTNTLEEVLVVTGNAEVVDSETATPAKMKGVGLATK